MAAQPPPTHDKKAWREFSGTPAGAMLRRIYGGQANAPKVDAPKPKTKPWEQPSTFIPAGGKVNVNPRETKINHREAASVRVPVVGQHKPVHVAAIDALPIRRKLKSAIDAQAAHDARTADRTGAPLRKPISTETEKRRLQAINTLKGGKGLPDELTMPSIEGNIPLHLVSSTRARGGGTSSKLGRSGAGSPVRGPDSRELREMNTIFNAIMAEMQAEEACLRRAQAQAESGSDADAEASASMVQLCMERIRDKVGDMQKLDKLIRAEKARLRALTAPAGMH